MSKKAASNSSNILDPNFNANHPKPEVPDSIKSTDHNTATPGRSTTATPTANQTASTTAPTLVPPPTVTIPTQNLLRIHIINASLKKECDPYVTITVGKKSSKTRTLSKTATPVFDEHFVVEYDSHDDRSEVAIAIYDKGHLMDDLVGLYRVNIQDVDKPSENAPPKSSKDKKKMKKKDEEKGLMSWYNMEPTSVKLTDKGGKNELGTLFVRLRREVKVVGSLTIKVKEVTLNSNDETKLVAKLDTQIHETEPTSGKKNTFKWKNSVFKFDVNEVNNVRDIFIECWQSNLLVGETRVTLFDARRKAVKGPQMIESKVIKQKIGDMRISSEFVERKSDLTTVSNTSSTTHNTTHNTTTTTTPAKK